MDSKELSQTGRQLLNKGKKSFIRAVFNRKTLLFVSLLLQAGILFSLYFWFEDNIPLFLGGSALFTVAVMLILVNSSMDPTAKVTWPDSSSPGSIRCRGFPLPQSLPPRGRWHGEAVTDEG